MQCLLLKLPDSSAFLGCCGPAFGEELRGLLWNTPVPLEQNLAANQTWNLEVSLLRNSVSSKKKLRAEEKFGVNTKRSSSQAIKQFL